MSLAMPAELNACKSQEVQSMAAQCMENPALGQYLTHICLLLSVCSGGEDRP